MLETLALLGTGFLALILILAVWETIWKGFGLWNSARNKHKIWFVCILILNTAGILPIIYLLLHKKKKNNGSNISRKLPKRNNRKIS